MRYLAIFLVACGTPCPSMDVSVDDAPIIASPDVVEASMYDAPMEALDVVLQCPQGTTLCGTSCTNLLYDPFNCGACYNTCTSSCTNGTCNCPAGEIQCGGSSLGACTDLTTDSANCGGCGISCQGGTCTQSRCTTCGHPQDAGPWNPYILCQGSCFDGYTDPRHCGTCDTVCSPTQSCIGSFCQ
jgi:hypothetical protein